MRNTKTEYVSCPSCGRTLFNLQVGVGGDLASPGLSASWRARSWAMSDPAPIAPPATTVACPALALPHLLPLPPPRPPHRFRK